MTATVTRTEAMGMTTTVMNAEAMGMSATVMITAAVDTTICAASVCTGLMDTVNDFTHRRRSTMNRLHRRASASFSHFNR